MTAAPRRPRRPVIAAAAIWLIAPVVIIASPPSARFGIKAPKTTTLSEPVIMTATLHNTTGYRVTADFGVDDQTRFVFRHTRPDGTQVRVEPALPAPRGRTSRLMLRGNSHTAFVVLDEWLDLTQPGLHQIDVEFLGSVAIEGGDEAALKRTARLPIEVKARDANRLEKRGAGWLKQVSTLSPGFETRAAASALVAMKDPVAIPYLELATSRTRSPKFADALAAMGSQEARAALQRLAASPDRDVSALAQRALGRNRTP